MPSRLREYFSLLKWGIHYDGWIATKYRIFLKASEAFGTEGTRSWRFLKYLEQNYDRRFGVETGRNPHLTDDSEAWFEESRDNVYSPVASTWFGHILSELPVDLSEFTFVDLGSGKGRALFMASEFPFEQVVGVELEQPLHETAVKNLSSFDSPKQECSSIHPVNMDVTEFELPEKPLVIYMFNPFPASVLRRVVNKIAASFWQRPRQIIILYYNPVHKEVLDESCVLEETDFGLELDSDWVIYAAAA